MIIMQVSFKIIFIIIIINENI